MGRLQSIQILRFVAAAMVVSVHLGPNRVYGASGVDIFFVISGFIIAHVMHGKSPSRFLRDRVLRIYPIYLIVSAPFLLFMPFHLDRFLTSLTLWPVFADYNRPYLAVGWSLSFEMLFYVGAATVLLVPRSSRWLPLGYAGAMATAFVTGSPLLRFIANPIILEFAMGVGIALLPRARGRLCAVALVAGAAGLLMPVDPGMFDVNAMIALQQPLRPLVVGLPAALIVWGALGFEDLLRGRAVEFLAYLGDASYSIYLTHILSLLILREHLPPFIAWSGAIVIGVAVYRYIEAPLLLALKGKVPRAQIATA